MKDRKITQNSKICYLKFLGVPWSGVCWALSPPKWKLTRGPLYPILIRKRRKSLWTYLDFRLIYNTCGCVALTCLSNKLLTKLFTNSGARAREGVPADLGCSTRSSSPWPVWSNRSSGACDIFGRLMCYIKRVQIQVRELQEMPPRFHCYVFFSFFLSLQLV